MLVLGLDTATSGCAVALVETGKGGDAATLAAEAAQMPRGQSEALMPMVEQVMQAAGRSLKEVELFAVTAGPGAFTGLRIGLAAARGMALAAGKPCIGVTTFDALAHAIQAGTVAKRMILCIVESKRKDAFVQLYTPEHTQACDPATLRPDELAVWLDKKKIGKDGLVITGDAAHKFTDVLKEWQGATGIPVEILGGAGLPDPAVSARIAAALWEQDSDAACRSHPPRPVYLRAPDVSKPKEKSKRPAG